MDSKLRGRCRMHKYVLIPDSFKGTLSARDFCAVAREAIGRAALQLWHRMFWRA